MRDATPVTVIQDTGPMEGSVEQHPAFGMICINNVHAGGGGVRLFGSSLQGHPGFISLKVHRAERKHSHARDWFHSTDQIIEVWISHAQFAEFITTPNQGSGVPCTIRYTAEEGPVPGFIPVETEADKIRAKVADEAATIVANLMATRARVEAALANVPAKARKVALDEIDTLIRDVGSNMPFYVESLKESMEKTVADAKTEVEAFVNHSVRAAGLQVIAEKGAGSLRLPGPVEDSDL